MCHNADFLYNHLLYKYVSQWIQSSYILRRPQNFVKYPPYFCPMQYQSKVRWRFCKILWPSQNILPLIRQNTRNTLFSGCQFCSKLEIPNFCKITLHFFIRWAWLPVLFSDIFLKRANGVGRSISTLPHHFLWGGNSFWLTTKSHLWSWICTYVHNYLTPNFGHWPENRISYSLENSQPISLQTQKY